MGFRTVQTEVIHASAAESSDSETDAQNSGTADIIEVWIRATAISGTPTFPVQASADGVNFSEIDATLTLAAPGITQKTFARENFPLGTKLRVAWVLGGGSGTFEIRIIRQER